MSFPAVYIARQFSSIIQNLRLYAHEGHPELIHALRVNIKKIRALYSFLNKTQAGKKFPKKILQQLFSDAGAIRENLINMTLLKKKSRSPKLVYGFMVKDRVLRAEFSKKVPGYIRSVKRAANKKTQLHGYSGINKTKKYFDKQVAIAAALINNPSDKESVHHFRKKIKRMMYVYDALPGRLQKRICIDVGYLDKLQTIAGAWHDTFMAAAFIEENCSSTARYTQKLKQREKRLLNNLIRSCKDFAITAFQKKNNCIK